VAVVHRESSGHEHGVVNVLVVCPSGTARGAGSTPVLCEVSGGGKMLQAFASLPTRAQASAGSSSKAVRAPRAGRGSRFEFVTRLSPRRLGQEVLMAPRRWATRDDQDLVALYLADIGRHPLLSKDEEVMLAQRIEAGADAREQLDGKVPRNGESLRELRRRARDAASARRRFVEANLRLVVSIAKRYRRSGLNFLDLVQEGNLGLMRAVDKFEWRKGFKFSTYATWWIRQAIQRGIANTARTIRLPVHAANCIARVGGTRARLEAELGRSPSRAEIADGLELPEDELAELMTRATPPVSLSEPLTDNSNSELADIVADPLAASPSDAATDALLAREIVKQLEPLTPRERKVLLLRAGLDCGEPRTLAEVGEFFALTRERIRQIEAKALAKLRHPTSNSVLRELLAD
jgi:RNA polymerase sigma factor (sigma-70 family)